MATAPAFAATPICWSGLVPATADTSLTAPTNATALGTAGASGTQINEIVCVGVGTTVAGVVNIFAYDGSTYHLVDFFIVPAYTSSTTVGAWRASRTYQNFWLPANTWSLRCTVTVASDQSMVKVTAFGGSM
jgi:hypothetical protein